MGKNFDVYKLQLPVFNMSSLKVIYEDHRTYASDADVSPNNCTRSISNPSIIVFLGSIKHWTSVYYYRMLYFGYLSYPSCALLKKKAYYMANFIPLNEHWLSLTWSLLLVLFCYYAIDAHSQHVLVVFCYRLALVKARGRSWRKNWSHHHQLSELIGWILSQWENTRIPVFVWLEVIF